VAGEPRAGDRAKTGESVERARDRHRARRYRANIDAGEAGELRRRPADPQSIPRSGSRYEPGGSDGEGAGDEKRGIEPGWREKRGKAEGLLDLAGGEEISLRVAERAGDEVVEDREDGRRQEKAREYLARAEAGLQDAGDEGKRGA